MGSITWKLIAVFLQAFGKAAVDFPNAWLRQRQQDAQTDRVAVEVAAARTVQDIAETAHAQAEINAVDRGGASDVARRVRERLAHQSDNARHRG